MKRPFNVAHRGGAGLAPENTLAAFANALTLNVDAVELDVHMSKDGALVVMHDPDVRATTGHRGEIRSLTLAELQRLNAAAKYKGGEIASQRIPRLEDVLAMVQGHAMVQIEIKCAANGARYAGIETRVVDRIRAYDMLEQVAIISFDFPTLRDIKALAPTLQTCALISSAYLKRIGPQRRPTSVVEDLVAHGFDCVGVKHSCLSRRLFDMLRAQGFQVGVWTVNEPATMRTFAASGVDFITTDRPDLLNDVLK